MTGKQNEIEDCIIYYSADFITFTKLYNTLQTLENFTKESYVVFSYDQLLSYEVLIDPLGAKLPLYNTAFTHS